MLGLFLNPGFLFIGVALISVPIIIHLINRMRFRRIHWAAMEFLLKAQKRTRRRLIIEQLILLMLRCLLIFLVLMLVARFIGCGDSNLTGKPSLHLVLLDDTVSMRDGEKKDKGGVMKTCFDAARTEILIDKIAAALSKTKTTDRLIILPLSKIDDPGFDIKEHTFERLNNAEHLNKLKVFINELQPSYMHVSPVQGIKKVEELMGEHGDSVVTLHLIGDFRDTDWNQARGGDALTKQLVKLVIDRSGEVKLRIIDTVDPPRSKGQQGYPKARENVGIVDFYPTTRIAGANARVGFKVKIKNFSGQEAEAFVVVRDGVTGEHLFQVDFDQPVKPLKIKANAETEVSFEHQFNPNPLKNPTPFEHLSVRLTNPQLGPLAKDGLLEDNVRYAFVEVRNRVPILIVDGEKAKGREENKDSFHVVNALLAGKGKFQIEFGDEISPGKVTDVLEKVDLRKYAGIFLLNVPDLTPKQVTILENYVNDGGGVAFFLGPQVKVDHYNKALYREGKGLFPAPLKAPFYYPKPESPALEPKGTDTLHLLIRDDKFGSAQKVPIFSEFLQEPKHRFPFYDMPVGRYFQVNRSLWKREPDRVFELATLPNDEPAQEVERAVADLTRGPDARGILDDKEFAKYQTRFKNHLNAIEDLVRPGSDFKSYHLAGAIEFMFIDKGDGQAKDNMSEFWTNPEPRVQRLRSAFTNLREQVQYGDAFVVARKFGKGKVVAFMSTAGKDWNGFAGGSLSTRLYAPFILETTNYLSSSGIEANLTVGANVTIKVDAEQFKGMKLSLSRTFLKTEDGKPQERSEPVLQPGTSDGNQVVFNLTKHGMPGKHQEPGLWVSELVEDGAPKKVLASFAHVFNVDTEREGNLHRISSDELTRELTSKAEKGEIAVVTVNDPDDLLVGKTNDFSESPWLFLMFLLILVAEQALAVHLSFHLKSDDQELQPAGLRV